MCYAKLTDLPFAMNLDESCPRQGFRRTQHGAKAKNSKYTRERALPPCACIKEIDVFFFPLNPIGLVYFVHSHSASYQ